MRTSNDTAQRVYHLIKHNKNDTDLRRHRKQDNWHTRTTVVKMDQLDLRVTVQLIWLPLEAHARADFVCTTLKVSLEAVMPLFDQVLENLEHLYRPARSRRNVSQRRADCTDTRRYRHVHKRSENNMTTAEHHIPLLLCAETFA